MGSMLVILSITQIKVLASGTDDFMITVKTDNTGTSSDVQFVVGTSGGGYNYNIDCDNDGTDEATAQTGNYTCDYGAGNAGTYTIRIEDNTGSDTGFPRFVANAGGDDDKLLTVSQWGTLKWTSMETAFFGCVNLTSVSTSDNPDLSGVTNLGSIFRDATSFNSNISGWNTSTITSMTHAFKGASSFNQNLDNWTVDSVADFSYMFWSASSFNQNLNSWNTENATNMSGLFASATSFNGNITNWDVSAVTTLYAMFYGTKFNQDISIWDVDNVTNLAATFRRTPFNYDISGWNIGNVTTMSSTFRETTAFNQNLTWDTSGVEDMGRMFRDAKAFNQDIGGWDISSVTSMDDMFDGVTLTRDNYEALLIGFDSQSLESGVSFDGGNSKYCTSSAKTARTSIIDNDSWTIVDGGEYCGVESFAITNVVIMLENENTEAEEGVKITFTPPANIKANSIFEIQYDQDFRNGDTLEDSDISTTSSGGSLGTCTESNFAEGYFKIICTGTATTSDTISIDIGDSEWLLAPDTAGNYNFSVVVDNNGTHDSYFRGAGLAYVDNDNDVFVTAYVPSVLDMEIYEQNSSNMTNACALGVLSLNQVNTCVYDLAGATNNSAGLTIRIMGVDTSDWTTGEAFLEHSNNSDNVDAVSDGSVTSGHEEYGFQITDDGSTNQYVGVGNYETQNEPVPSSETSLANTNVRLDGINEVSDRLEVTHYASMATDTIVGDYTQGIVYTVYTN